MHWMVLQSMHRNLSGYFNTACVHISRCGGYIKQTGGVERAFEAKQLCKYRSAEAKGAPIINTLMGRLRNYNNQGLCCSIYMKDRSLTNLTQGYNIISDSHLHCRSSMAWYHSFCTSSVSAAMAKLSPRVYSTIICLFFESARLLMLKQESRFTAFFGTGDLLRNFFSFS